MYKKYTVSFVNVITLVKHYRRWWFKPTNNHLRAHILIKKSRLHSVF